VKDEATLDFKFLMFSQLLRILFSNMIIRWIVLIKVYHKDEQILFTIIKLKLLFNITQLKLNIL
jgi:hypothetical protein